MQRWDARALYIRRTIRSLTDIPTKFIGVSVWIFTNPQAMGVGSCRHVSDPSDEQPSRNPTDGTASDPRFDC